MTLPMLAARHSRVSGYTFRPADGVMLTWRRHGSTGVVVAGNGVPLGPGVCSDLDNLSMWSEAGVEVEMGVTPTLYTHANTNDFVMPYIFMRGDEAEGTRFWLRTNTPYTVPRATAIAPSAIVATPASYLWPEPTQACEALPMGQKLVPYHRATQNPALRPIVLAYPKWINEDDWVRYSNVPSGTTTGGINGGGARIAIYGRGKTLINWSWMTGDPTFADRALKLLAGGNTTGSQFLTSLSSWTNIDADNPPTNYGNAAALGNEWNLDPDEALYGYYVSCHEGYLKALDWIGLQLHYVRHIGRTIYDGTRYNLDTGWGRDSTRGFGASFYINKNGRNNAKNPQYFEDTGWVGNNTSQAKMAAMVNRMVKATGEASNPFLATAASCGRSPTDNTKAALLEEITQQSGGVEFQITARDIDLTGFDIPATSAARMRMALLNWVSGAIVVTPGPIVDSIDGTITTITNTGTVGTITTTGFPAPPHNNEWIGWRVRMTSGARAGDLAVVASHGPAVSWNNTFSIEKWLPGNPRLPAFPLGDPAPGDTFRLEPHGQSDLLYNGYVANPPHLGRDFYPVSPGGVKLGQLSISTTVGTAFVGNTTVLPATLDRSGETGGISFHMQMAWSTPGTKPYENGIGQPFAVYAAYQFPQHTTEAADLITCVKNNSQYLYDTAWDAGLQAYYYGNNNSTGNGISHGSNTASRQAAGAYPALNGLPAYGASFRAWHDQDPVWKARAIAAIVGGHAPALTEWYSPVPPTFVTPDPTPQHRAADEFWTNVLPALWFLAGAPD